MSDTPETTEVQTEVAEDQGPMFTDLGLPDNLLRVLDDMGYKKPSPIQAQAIPPLLEGKDVLGLAQTGTGKTAAFALPILARTDAASRTPQVLVLAPTRELAMQVAKACEDYAKYTQALKLLLYTVVKTTVHKFVLSVVALNGSLVRLVVSWIT